MKSTRVPLVFALILIAIAGVVEFSASPSKQVPSFRVGQHGLPSWAGWKCRNQPGSYCVTTYLCQAYDGNPQVWICQECTAPSGTFKACVQWLESDHCSPQETTNPCGDYMEDYAVNVSGDCPTDCNPATITGPCTDHYKIYNCNT
jgi:hypothetical protein